MGVRNAGSPRHRYRVWRRAPRQSSPMSGPVHLDRPGFCTSPQNLAGLWTMLPEGTDPAEVLVVMEPTRNAWVPLAAWFRRHGALRRPGSAGSLGGSA
jgi:hypothetical protein